ncbi:MAG: hypothetical protein CVU64_14380 [Deltaproteobacteria bacterium HGW-Deltaproteobacteria-21]|nr:MAG: hypothetical protein CVU64_14380 [Deltaproteobacteria bacterium HGW-Deltaproteobacteria-21]
MSRNLTIRTNFWSKTGKKEQILIPHAIGSVEELLRFIGEDVGFVFLDSGSGKLRPDIEVILNGKEIFFYPDQLQTVLKSGDVLEITLIPLGGG